MNAADVVLKRSSLKSSGLTLLPPWKDLTRRHPGTTSQAPLLQVLYDLERQPYTRKSVRRYKRAKERADAPNMINYLFWRPARAIFFASGLGIFLALGSAFVFLIGSLLTEMNTFADQRAWFLSMAEWSMLAAVVFLVLCLSALAIWRGQERSWCRVTLYVYQYQNQYQYRSPVPLWVLETTEAIKARCLLANFEIDYLEKDPLLVVSEGFSWFRRRYYVEYWDEPGYPCEL